MTAGSGVLLVLLSLSGALRVSCRPPPGGSRAGAARAGPRSRRGAHRSGGLSRAPRPAPGVRAAHTSACPAPALRSAACGRRNEEPRISGERRCRAGWECGGWEPGIPARTGTHRASLGRPKPRPLPGARLSRSGAGCPLAEPARPPSPESHAPPELASPARARAVGVGSQAAGAGDPGVEAPRLILLPGDGVRSAAPPRSCGCRRDRL